MGSGERWFTPAKTVLLTGTGFTHPFGGYLASEMWAAILNQLEICGSDTLRNLMLGELNYETLYDRVLNDYPAEKDAFTKAIRNAYQQMHEVIFPGSTERPERAESAGLACQNFLSRFAGREKERGFFFTLNQDLFVERFYIHGHLSIEIPGLSCSNWFSGALAPSLKPGSQVQLPGEDIVSTLKSTFWDKSDKRFIYIKLHGSYGWKAKDGSDVMVIGHAKTKIIKNEPLLQWYLSLFEEVLHEPGRNLVVIGYGFGDDHINNVIADAMRDSGLRLYVVSPRLPKDFREKLSPISSVVERVTLRGEELWQGLFGYYRTSVTKLYQASGDPTPQGRQLFRDLGLT